MLRETGTISPITRIVQESLKDHRDHGYCRKNWVLGEMLQGVLEAPLLPRGRMGSREVTEATSSHPSHQAQCLTGFIRIFTIEVFIPTRKDECITDLLKKYEKTSGMTAEVPNSTALVAAVSLTA